jgi:hypothetical protein
MVVSLSWDIFKMVGDSRLKENENLENCGRILLSLQ